MPEVLSGRQAFTRRERELDHDFRCVQRRAHDAYSRAGVGAATARCDADGGEFFALRRVRRERWRGLARSRVELQHRVPNRPLALASRRFTHVREVGAEHDARRERLYRGRHGVVGSGSERRRAPLANERKAISAYF